VARHHWFCLFSVLSLSALASAHALRVRKTPGDIFFVDLQNLLDRAKQPGVWRDVRVEPLPGGIRLSNLRRDPWFAKLGIEDGDVITALDGRPVAALEDLVASLGQRVVQRPGSPLCASLQIRREGRKLSLRYWTDAACLFEDGAASTTAAARPISDETIASGITVIGANRYAVKRSLVDSLLERRNDLARAGRPLPHMKNGERDGFVIYAVRPNAFYAQLGLKSGDTITAINGLRLTADEQITEAWFELGTANRVTLHVRRPPDQEVDFEYDLR
jgi:S1-C subfamily serine protease